MPLNTPRPPEASISALHAVLATVADRPGVAAGAPAIARGAALAAPPALSVQVFVLGADAIAAGRDLSAVHRVFWTHFLPTDDGGAGEVIAGDVNAETGRFAAVSEGAHARDFYRQVEILRQAPEFAAASLDLLQLRVPALHVNAVWLKGAAGAEGDLLIPIAPTDPALTPGRRYAPADFFAALRPAAAFAVSQTDPLKGG